MFNFSNFRLKNFVPLCLGLILGLLLTTVSSVMASFSTSASSISALPASTSLASVPAAPSPSTVNGCIGGASNPNRSINLDGRVITPSTLLRISNNCAPNETALSLSTTGASSTYVRTIIVSPTPGAPDTTNGMNLINALNSIGSNPAYPPANATNPYLIKIEPGVYNISNTSLQMKPFVDIEGSGEDVTTILGNLYDTNGNQGVVLASNNSELRFITVADKASIQITGTTNAIYTEAVDSTARFTHVTALASGAQDNRAIKNSNSSPTLKDVTAITVGAGYGTGILNMSSSPLIQNLRVEIKDATNNFGIRNGDSSPVIQGAVITVSGGVNSYGISNATSTVTATDTIINVNGASTGNYGIYNNTTRLNLQNSQVNAGGGNVSYGLFNQDYLGGQYGPYALMVLNSNIGASSSVAQNVAVFNGTQVNYNMDNSTLMVAGGVASSGIGISNTGIITLHNSTIQIGNVGTGYGIYNASNTFSAIAKLFDSSIYFSVQTDGYGLYNLKGTVNLYNDTIATEGVTGNSRGIYSKGDAATSALLTINGGNIKGTTTALHIDSPGGGTQSVAKVGNAQLDGPVTIVGTATCIGVYNGSYVALSASCN